MITSLVETGFTKNDLEGWTVAGRMLRFNPNSLSKHINGGAEIFLEFGFEELCVQRYNNGADELIFEIYRMESPEAALGIYLLKCGAEAAIQGITARNSASRYQFTVLKGSHFILANNFSGDVTKLPAMVAITRHILSAIPEQEPLNLLDFLPGDRLVSGSERLIRGPFALQPIYTFGEGDILQLCGKIFGIAGNYRIDPANDYTLILIFYPTNELARSAYHNLITNLDPYLTIVRQSNTSFVFKDYQNKFGIVKIIDVKLEIKIKLPELPGDLERNQYDKR